VPRRFGHGLHSHRGDHPPHRNDFLAGVFFTRFEPRHLDGPRFPYHCSCPTGSYGEVQKTMKTSLGCMIKC
jgi:hypothetical protein